MFEDERIRIRGLEYEDLAKLHQWMNDQVVLNNILRIEPSIRYFTEKWYESIHQDNSKKIFAIEDKQSGNFIGCIGANNIDYINRKGELYIYLGDQAFQGKGFAKIAVILFLKYLFGYLNLRKIYLHVRSDNLRAINLYKKVGFIEEGFFKQERYMDGQYIDIIRMCLFKEALE